MPIATILSILSHNLSSLRIFIEFFITLIFCVYILVISLYSPCPPLLNHWMGPTLILISWIFTLIMVQRIRLCIAIKLEICGEKTLLIIGGCTMLGQCIGSIIMFIIVDTYKLLEEAPVCVNVRLFCQKR